MIVHFALNNVGSVLTKNSVYDWVVLQDHNTIHLNNILDSELDVILSHVSSKIVNEIRNDILWNSRRKKMQAELVKGNMTRNTTSESIIQFIQHFGTNGTAEFIAFCKTILDSPDALAFCTDLRNRNIHTGWLATMGV